MKKRVGLFVTVLILAMCFFALSISASDKISYDDFAQAGANGEAPIFSFLGYSVNEGFGGITAGYKVNKEALQAYEESNGTRLKYGIVGAYKGFLDGKAPLDPQTGKPIDISHTGKTILYYESDGYGELLNLNIVGFDRAEYTEKFFISLFTFDGENVKYLTGDKSTEMPDDISISKARGAIYATVNNMKFGTETETTLSYDRLRQMAESEAAYNKITIDDSEYSSTQSKVNTVILGGSLIGWNNAAKLLQHFMDNTGTQYTLDMNDFFEDSTVKGFRNQDINNALRAAEMIAIEGEIMSVDQTTENLHKPSGDWYYALGSYFTDVDIRNLTVTTDENGVKTYTADITYIATDFYNWDKNNTWPVIDKKLLFIHIQGPSPAELYRLHNGGRAQEFLTYGEITYTGITWTEGQTVENLGF